MKMRSWPAQRRRRRSWPSGACSTRPELSTRLEIVGETRERERRAQLAQRKSFAGAPICSRGPKVVTNEPANQCQWSAGRQWTPASTVVWAHWKLSGAVGQLVVCGKCTLASGTLGAAHRALRWRPIVWRNNRRARQKQNRESSSPKNCLKKAVLRPMRRSSLLRAPLFGFRRSPKTVLQDCCCRCLAARCFRARNSDASAELGAIKWRKVRALCAN